LSPPHAVSPIESTTAEIASTAAPRILIASRLTL
jgi:hypothetical protein